MPDETAKCDQNFKRGCAVLNDQKKCIKRSQNGYKKHFTTIDLYKKSNKKYS
jgi:hypothetical protein